MYIYSYILIDLGQAHVGGYREIDTSVCKSVDVFLAVILQYCYILTDLR